MQWDRISLGKMAKDLGFPRDTLEKVCRLADVLKFFESDALLAESIALKGGTAINLTIFNLPRLSVDIDLDYCRCIDRDDMLSDRTVITERISKYMVANGYILSAKSKNYHALDSFVYEYVNCGGVKDNLKIEINYMYKMSRPNVQKILYKNVQLI
jgi:predicted nucleotidyltransferase component of viral defense system